MSREIDEIRDRLRQFAAERDWNQFHSPKNLASALIVESAELLEVFQWLSEERSAKLSAEEKISATEELADVFIYAVRLADKLDIDLIEAARSKIAKNELKYAVDKARGNSTKYTKL
jgi:NTP pyrophosphatase (non-canonical NTP hydrolase)